MPEYFKQLHNRCKRVRITSGDWKRVVTPSVTYNNIGLSNNGITGLFLDPPYSKENRNTVYKHDNDIFKEVCDFAIAHDNIKNFKIIICGYEGTYNFPSNWNSYSWQTGGGMSALGNSQGKINKYKEKIWFNF